MFGQGLNFGGIAGGVSPYDIEYLVVAGGASGGGWGGGGGAGGYRTSTISQMAVGVQMTITVGAGGTAPITGT